MDWASVFEFYVKFKRELREAVLASEASYECKKVIWEEVSRLLERKSAELEERVASR